MRFLGHIVGEAAAALLLRFKGQRIVSRRFNTPAGLIPFVTLQGNRLAFIDMKRNRVAIIPSRHKRRIIRGAQYWLAAHPDFSGYEIAFDAVFGGALPRYVTDVIMLPRPGRAVEKFEHRIGLWLAGDSSKSLPSRYGKTTPSP